MIRTAILAAALVFALSPALATDADDIVRTVNAYNDMMNKADFQDAAAYYTASPAIIDEFSPHFWSGASAFTQWGADYDTFAKAHAMSEPSTLLAKPLHVRVQDDRGYAEFPATFRFKHKGKPYHENGVLTFALRKTGGAWKIAGWAWMLE
jgi:ketosteroid isomerase-like protein